LWLDPDVRWLTGVHEAEGHVYLVREMYEELIWWLLMPSLLGLASEATLSRIAVEKIWLTVEEALSTAEAAGYRVDSLLGSVDEPAAGLEAVPDVASEAPEADEGSGVGPGSREEGNDSPAPIKKETLDRK
jgi:hypothetical protein